MNIPDSVQSIGVGAFGECTSLQSIVIPPSVTVIERNMFYSCAALTEITIPVSVKTIDKLAFYSCYGLDAVYYDGDIDDWMNVSIHESYANPLHIAAKLYIRNTSVTEVTVPDGVTIINSVFSDCTAMTSVTVPRSVRTIEDLAFWELYRA